MQSGSHPIGRGVERRAVLTLIPMLASLILAAVGCHGAVISAEPDLKVGGSDRRYRSRDRRIHAARHS